MASRPPQNNRPVRPGQSRVNYREQQRRRQQRLRLYAIVGVGLVVVIAIGIAILINATASHTTPNAAAVTYGPDKRTGDLKVNQRGNPTAKVTLVEYGDFQCPNCANYDHTTGVSVMHDYVDTGKVKFEYRVFPFIDKGAGKPEGDSFRAGMAVYCAGDQNRFWDYFETIYANQGDGENTNAFSNDRLKDFAKALGLNTDTFGQCLDSRKYANTVGDSYQASVNAGINATPTFLINDKQITISTYDDVKTQLDAALAAAK